MTAGFISRSHRAIAPFALHRPTSIAQAVDVLASGAIPHAGGIDLVERMQQGERIAEVADLAAIDALRIIDVADGVLCIGAGVTHARIESDPVIARARPDLAAAWRTVGNVRIRRTGTVGGNLMAFDPNYDAAPILAAAGATLVFQSTEGEVRSGVVDRPPSLLLTRIEVPIEGRPLRFDRSLKPVVSVAVGDHVAIGCAYPAVRLVDDVSELPPPIDDAEASADYRRRMIGVLVERLSEGAR
jgi:carbon-monoxide dehydrogenase medium subunit